MTRARHHIGRIEPLLRRKPAPAMMIYMQCWPVESSEIRGRVLAWFLGGGYAQACTVYGALVSDCAFGSPLSFWDWCLGLKPKGKGFLGVVSPAWDSGPAGWLQAVESLVDRGYRVDPQGCLMDGGTPWAVSFLQKGYRTIRLIDFHNFIRSSLFELAMQGGDERQKRERPYDLNGCRQDSLIMRETFTLLILATSRRYAGGGLPQTISGLAADIWRVMLPPSPRDRIACTQKKHLLRTQRQYCGGGRIEMPRGKTTGPLWMFDISSQYPALAVAGGLPVDGRDWALYALGDLEECRRRVLDVEGCHFAVCEVLQTEDDFALLGERKLDGMSFYGAGSWVAALCGAELVEAMRRGLVVSVMNNSVATMGVKGSPFHRYVKRFYELKRTAKLASERDASKILLVSLLGRTAGRGGCWAMAGEDLLDVIEGVSADCMDAQLYFDRVLFQDTLLRDGLPAVRHLPGYSVEWLMKERAEAWYSQPAYWAALTAAARVQVSQVVEGVEAAGGVCAAVLTDAVYVDEVGKDWMLENADCGDGMGQWQIDNSEPCTDFCFFSPGVYDWRGESKAAGRRLDAKERLGIGWVALSVDDGYAARLSARRDTTYVLMREIDSK